MVAMPCREISHLYCGTQPRRGKNGLTPKHHDKTEPCRGRNALDDNIRLFAVRFSGGKGLAPRGGEDAVTHRDLEQNVRNKEYEESDIIIMARQV